MHKIRTHHQHGQGKFLAWMALWFSLAVSMIHPVFPIFIKTIVDSETNVSIFYAAMSIVMFLAAIFSTILFRKFQRTTIIKAGLIIGALAFFTFILITRLTSLVIVDTILVCAEISVFIALSLFVRDFANAKNLGRAEGRHYKFQNIGYFFGPLFGGFFAIIFGHEFAFLTAAFIMMGVFFHFHHKHIVENHPAIINRKIIKPQALLQNIKKFFSNKERAKCYVITLTIMGWYAFKRLYIPLYVAASGFLPSVSGLILATIILPLIFLEIKVGEYADKHGFKIPLASGFLIIAILFIIIFISPFPILNFILLILTSLGGALVEPLQEAYLFKHMKKEEEDELYGVYMTADPVAFFLVPTIGTVVLLFLPFKFLFLEFGLLVLATSYFIWKALPRLSPDKSLP